MAATAISAIAGIGWWSRANLIEVSPAQMDSTVIALGSEMQVYRRPAPGLVDHGSSASTVSPPMARWPTLTRGSVPGGR